MSNHKDAKRFVSELLGEVEAINGAISNSWVDMDQPFNGLYHRIPAGEYYRRLPNNPAAVKRNTLFYNAVIKKIGAQESIYTRHTLPSGVIIFQLSTDMYTYRHTFAVCPPYVGGTKSEPAPIIEIEGVPFQDPLRERLFTNSGRQLIGISHIFGSSCHIAAVEDVLKRFLSIKPHAHNRSKFDAIETLCSSSA